MTEPVPDVERLVEQFTAGTLPEAEWTHRAHLAVGAWHLQVLGPAQALDAIREGILRLNAQHGTPNTDTRGYHETITRAYVALIAGELARARPVTANDAAACVLSSPIALPGVLLQYYSKDLLMSAAARRGWVEPDLQPLPGTAASR